MLAAQSDLGIGPETCVARSGGERFDMGLTIDALLCQEGLIGTPPARSTPRVKEPTEPYWANDAEGRPVFYIPDGYDDGDPTFN